VNLLNDTDVLIHSQKLDYDSGDHLKINSKMSYTEAKVLVVEDNEINQAVIDGILEMFGIGPTFAKNGEECLELLNKNKYDLIFMDILMPVMNGFKATYAIRNSHKEYKDIAIVAMTSNTLDKEVEQCYKAGMNEFLSKPIKIELVSRILNKYLNPFRQEIASISEPSVSYQTGINEELVSCPGIDIDEGINRFGGKRNAYFRTINKFASDLTIEKLKFEDFYAQEKVNENAKFIHTLKGVSGNLSIKKVYNKTVLLEKSFLDGTLDENTFLEWINICTEVKKDILAVHPIKQVKNGKKIGSRIDFSTCLTSLRKALEHYSASACEEFLETLRGSTWDNVPDDFLEELCKSIEDYEFEYALNLLNNWDYSQQN
jgi:polar amino acid transport system substrate-binding protein